MATSDCSNDIPNLLKVGDVAVFPDQDVIRRHGTEVALTPRSMDVLVYLAERPDVTVSVEELLQALWANDYISDNAVHKAISEIRHALGDEHDRPRFIRTVRKRGYRLIAPVSGSGVSIESMPKPRWRVPAVLALGTTVFIGLILLLWPFSNIDEPTGAKGGSRPPPHSVAVLPLDNYMNDPAQSYFVESMRDALITNLAKISALHVPSTASVTMYAGTTKSSRQIGSELNVSKLLQGSVFREGEQVRISVRLIDAATDKHLWAESYERNLSDILSLQKEVARAVAREIQVRLRPTETASLQTAQPINPDAYEAFLKGEYYASSYRQHGADPALLRKSIGFYQHAVQQEPEWAEAHAGLAGAYHWLASIYDRGHNPDLWEKARSAAQTALELDPGLAQAHSSLGFVLHNYDWDWEGAERAYHRAAELDPFHTWGYALFLLSAGQLDEAITNFKLAEARNPTSPHVKTQLGFAYHCAERVEEALAQLQLVTELSPTFTYAHLTRAYVFMAMGKHGEAVALLERTIGPKGDRASPLWPHLGYAYALGGHTDRAQDVLRALETEAYGFLPGLAELYVALGQKDQAIGLYEAAAERRDPRLLDVRCTPGYEFLESDPRFQAVLKRIKFPNQRRSLDT